MQMDVMQLVCRLKTETHIWSNPGLTKLFQNDGVVEYLLKKCREASIDVFMTIGNNQECFLCSDNSVTSKRAVDMVENEWVILEKITVDDQNVSLLSHSSFRQLLQTIETDSRHEIAVDLTKS